MTSVAGGYCNQQNNHGLTIKSMEMEVLKESMKDPFVNACLHDLIEIHYANEMISLQSETAEGCFSLQLTDIASSLCHYVPYIFVGESASIDLDSGEYEVRAIDSNGQAYIGLLIIQ